LIIAVLVVTGIVQAIYGLLQLYGIYPSHHGLFKITGGFFNPGPYAGFLAAIWPLVLGVYLFRHKFPSFQLSNNKRLEFLTSACIKAVSFLKRIIKNKWFKRHYNDIQTLDHKKVIHQTERFLTDLVYQYLPLIGLISMLLVIPATRSRAAWLSVAVTSGLL
jgi:hypothetical protein